MDFNWISMDFIMDFDRFQWISQRFSIDFNWISIDLPLEAPAGDRTGHHGRAEPAHAAAQALGAQGAVRGAENGLEIGRKGDELRVLELISLDESGSTPVLKLLRIACARMPMAVRDRAPSRGDGNVVWAVLCLGSIINIPRTITRMIIKVLRIIIWYNIYIYI